MTDDVRQLAHDALARAEAATPGPWHCSAEEVFGIEDGEGRFDHVVWGPDEWVCTAGTYEKRRALNEDAAFIAAARHDVPALARAVLELSEQVDRLRDIHLDEREERDMALYKERLQLTNECDRLRGMWGRIRIKASLDPGGYLERLLDEIELQYPREAYQ